MMSIRTIEDCNEELAQIDEEIVKLQIKRRLLRIERELLGGEAVQRKAFQDPSFVSFHDILYVIRENPGLNGRAIGDKFNPPRTKDQMGNALVYLRNLDVIENRGKHGVGARWYIKEELC